MRGLQALSLGFAVLLTGCATTYQEAPVAVSNDIVFKRNPGFAGFDCTTKITIDGFDATVLKMNSVSVIELSAGRHMVEAGPNTGSCAAFRASRIIVAKTTIQITIKVERE